MGDDVVHVLLLIDARNPVPPLPTAGVMRCEVCGRRCWYDPAACPEMPPHRHACMPCTNPGDGDVGATVGSIQRAMRVLRARDN